MLATFTEGRLTSEDEDGSAIVIGLLGDTVSVTSGPTADSVIRPGDFAINQASQGTPAAVPEPSSLAMALIAGLAGLGSARSRRRGT